MSEIYEIPNGAAQRDLNVGECLLIPDLANVGHHTVVAGETLKVLAQRWYGDEASCGRSSRSPTTCRRRPGAGHDVAAATAQPPHTVVAGDTLWKLTEVIYGDGGTIDPAVPGEDGRGRQPHRRSRPHQRSGSALYFPSFDLGG